MHGFAGMIVFLTVVVIIALGVGVNYVKHDHPEWRGPSDRS